MQYVCQDEDENLWNEVNEDEEDSSDSDVDVEESDEELDIESEDEGDKNAEDHSNEDDEDSEEEEQEEEVDDDEDLSEENVGNGQTDESDVDGSDSDKINDSNNDNKKVNNDNTNTEKPRNIRKQRLRHKINKNKNEIKTVSGDEYAEYDTSDEEDIRNTVGNIPMNWYDEYRHLGYDWDGNKILKPEGQDQLDAFLKRIDDPDFWRTVKDPQTGQEVKLNDEDIKLIRRIQGQKIPDETYDEYAVSVLNFIIITTEFYDFFLAMD